MDLKVKVIKQVSNKEFLVADATGFHKIQTEGVLPHKYKKKLRENNYVKIKDALVDLRKLVVKLDMETKVLYVGEFPVDEDNPADVYVCIFIITFFS